jgi:hypothetical protein
MKDERAVAVVSHVDTVERENMDVHVEPHRAVGSLNRLHRTRLSRSDAPDTEQAFGSLPQRSHRTRWDEVAGEAGTPAASSHLVQAQQLLGESTGQLGAKTPIVPKQRS